jgi:hypothetical protein
VKDPSEVRPPQRAHKIGACWCFEVHNMLEAAELNDHQLDSKTRERDEKIRAQWQQDAESQS